ncbi:MAG: Ni/Fe hydrogenase subunit alpha [Planctomycetes bacterium]|nr:Ni/Fe hydrogenase subunit alpha [Planctomycetota bacterium]
MSEAREIKVDYLARVEGEGGMTVKVRDGKVEDVQVRIYEPPRFFEAFLRGRKYIEASDITARICGICPVAYQMSAVHAMEQAFGVTVGGQLRELRRLLYCGEWIESHVLHVYMLHAPDFLGYQDAISLARDHRAVVEQGLRLKKIGNEIVTTLAGREIHPINVRVGGFYRVPLREDFAKLRKELDWALDAAVKTVDFVAGLPFPDFEPQHEYVALLHPEEYPFNEGDIASTAGLRIKKDDFLEHFEELHVRHSNALHGRIKARGPYFVGPQARYNLNRDRLSPIAREAADRAGLGARCDNPFKSIVVRAVETVEACAEAIRILDAYERPDRPFVDYEIKAGVGHGCTEAPRGILYHRYEVDEKGDIVSARIIPPTAQNLPAIEADLRHFVTEHIDLDQENLTWKCEQAIRNYDPCISCATHFLKLEIDGD